VVAAKGLPAADRGGTSDPYVQIHLNGVTLKTKVIKKTLDPQWDETLEFAAGSFNTTDMMQVEVYDWDRFSKNHLLARNLLPVSYFFAFGTSDEWVPLNCVKRGSNAGSIHLKVKYGDGKPQAKEGDHHHRSHHHGSHHHKRQHHHKQKSTGDISQPASTEIPQQPSGCDDAAQQASDSDLAQQASGNDLAQQLDDSQKPRSGEPASEEVSKQLDGGDPPEQPGNSGPVSQQQSHKNLRHGIREAHEAFARYDTDQSGTISREELKPLLREVFGKRMNENLLERYTQAHFQSADVNKNGQLDLHEFLALYTSIKSEN
jgi:hypothetical protein